MHKINCHSHHYHASIIVFTLTAKGLVDGVNVDGGKSSCPTVLGVPAFSLLEPLGVCNIDDDGPGVNKHFNVWHRGRDENLAPNRENGANESK